MQIGYSRTSIYLLRKIKRSGKQGKKIEAFEIKNLYACIYLEGEEETMGSDNNREQSSVPF